jgi:hypothetical protein
LRIPSGEPDLQIGGFRLWVHGREFPDVEDYWDGNWLSVTARVEANGARVQADGPFLRNTEVAGFLDSIRTLYATLDSSAELRSLEPELAIVLKGDGSGGIAVKIDLTPDHLNQQHTFEFGMDQTYLQPLIASLEAILEKWPIRSSPDV